MNSCPPVSVIIPCYNGAAYLGEAIDSVLGQTYSPIEIVVVDDGSTDASADVIAGYGPRIGSLSQPNAGVSAARNAGLRKSHGDLVAFLDADDWWDREFVAKMVGAVIGSGAAMAYCGWQNVGVSEGRGKPFIPPDYEQDPDRLATLVGGARWPVHAALVRRDALDSVGGFNPSLRRCEDFDLWLRIAVQYPIARVPEVLAYYRFHSTQATTNRLGVVLDHVRVQRAFVNAHPQVAAALGRRRVRHLIYGALLNSGYEMYWKRDLPEARAVFRRVMLAGYGVPRDWMYMLPALLPLSWHRALLGYLDRGRGMA